MKLSGQGYRPGMVGRSRASKSASVLFAVALGALASVTLGGCMTGRPSSTSAWQSSSDRTLGQAISGLGTTRLVVQNELRNRMPHTYAVVAITDAIETSGKEISKYQISQPPDSLHGANATVGDALDEATSLMVEARVILASPGLTTKSAQRLISEIDDLRDKLDKLDKKVMQSPESVGSG